MYLMGIDLGTTGCKSMVFSPKQHILSEHYIEYELIFTPEGVEQDANEWWRHVQDAIIAGISKAGIDGRDIRGIAVGSQGISFVPVDKTGKTLMNAISWYDTRAKEEAFLIQSDPDAEDLVRRTGRRISPLVFPQIMWLKKHKADLYDQTWKFLMGLDFIQYRLCGATVTDYSMASGTLCYDTITHTWINALFERYGIDLNKMPQIGCFGDVVGSIDPLVARRLGLSEDVKVILGLQDQKCAALGAGIREGVLTVSLGTAGAVSSLSEVHCFDPLMRVFCHGFDRSRWMLESCVATAGAALRWVKNSFFPSLTYRDLDLLAQKAPPGSNGLFFYPLLSPGSQTEPPGRMVGINLNTSRNDVVRSVLEGVAFEIADQVYAHRQVNRQVLNATELHVFGGGSASPIWCQILADVTGFSVLVPQTREMACLGAVMCAGIGTGIFQNMKDAQDTCGLTWTRYQPDPSQNQLYRPILSDYLAARAYR